MTRENTAGIKWCSKAEGSTLLALQDVWAENSYWETHKTSKRGDKKGDAEEQGAWHRHKIKRSDRGNTFREQ